MLPTFKVRDIQCSSTLYDPLVKITAPEYDSTVSHRPDASLKYMDDDDGEIVTVGTSLELSQRLREPLSRAVDPSEPYHVFDINYREDNVEIWRSFIERTAEMHDDEPRSDPDFICHGLDEESSKPPARNLSGIFGPKQDALGRDGPASVYNEVDRRRKHYFRACNPPQLQFVEREADSISEEATILEHPTKLPSGCDEGFKSAEQATTTSLTREGRRQAQVAGERIRDLPFPKTPSFARDQRSYENRWASYNKSTRPFAMKHGGTIAPSVREDSIKTQASSNQTNLTEGTDRANRSKTEIDPSAQDLDEHRYDHSDRAPPIDLGDTAASTKNESHIAKKTVAPDLLQVFNSEFDKAAENTISTTGLTENRLHGVLRLVDSHDSSSASCHQAFSDIQKDESNLEVKVEEASLTTTRSEEINQSIRQSINDVMRAVASLQLQRLASSNESQSALQIAKALETGLNDALIKFDECLKSIASSAQKATSTLIRKFRSDVETQSENLQGAYQRYSKNILTPSQPLSHADSEDQPLSRNLNAPQGQGSSSEKQALPIPEAVRIDSLRHHRAGTSMPAETSVQPHLGNVLNSGYRSSLPITSQPSGSKACPIGPTLRRPSAFVDLPCQDIPSLGYQPRGPSNRSMTPVPPFPPPPSMKPLLPSTSAPRSYVQPMLNSDHSSLPICRSPTSNLSSLVREPTTTSGRERRWQPSNADNVIGDPSRRFGNESSGHFSNRVPGLHAGAAQFDASLDSSSNLNTAGRATALRRSATVASLNDPFSASIPQIHSSNYEGNCRMPWNASRSVRPHRRQSWASDDHIPAASRDRSDDSLSHLPMPGSSSSSAAATREYADESVSSTARECAKTLQELGFGNGVDGGMQRLLVYAQAAEGELTDAIDMIVEEQKAYGQRL